MHEINKIFLPAITIILSILMYNFIFSKTEIEYGRSIVAKKYPESIYPSRSNISEELSFKLNVKKLKSFQKIEKYKKFNFKDGYHKFSYSLRSDSECRVYLELENDDKFVLDQLKFHNLKEKQKKYFSKRKPCIVFYHAIFNQELSLSCGNSFFDRPISSISYAAGKNIITYQCGRFQNGKIRTWNEFGECKQMFDTDESRRNPNRMEFISRYQRFRQEKKEVFPMTKKECVEDSKKNLSYHCKGKLSGSYIHGVIPVYQYKNTISLLEAIKCDEESKKLIAREKRSDLYKIWARKILNGDKINSLEYTNYLKDSNDRLKLLKDQPSKKNHQDFLNLYKLSQLKSKAYFKAYYFLYDEKPEALSKFGKLFPFELKLLWEQNNRSIQFSQRNKVKFDQAVSIKGHFKKVSNILNLKTSKIDNYYYFQHDFSTKSKRNKLHVHIKDKNILYSKNGVWYYLRLNKAAQFNKIYSIGEKEDQFNFLIQKTKKVNRAHFFFSNKGKLIYVYYFLKKSKLKDISIDYITNYINRDSSSLKDFIGELKNNGIQIKNDIFIDGDPTVNLKKGVLLSSIKSCEMTNEENIFKGELEYKGIVFNRKTLEFDSYIFKGHKIVDNETKTISICFEKGSLNSKINQIYDPYSRMYFLPLIFDEKSILKAKLVGEKLDDSNDTFSYRFKEKSFILKWDYIKTKSYSYEGKLYLKNNNQKPKLLISCESPESKKCEDRDGLVIIDWVGDINNDGELDVLVSKPFVEREYEKGEQLF